MLKSFDNRQKLTKMTIEPAIPTQKLRPLDDLACTIVERAARLSTIRNTPCAYGRLVAQQPLQFLFCEFPFPRPTDPQGVNQRQKIVERRIVFRRDGNAAVEWLDCRALPRAVGIRPDGDRGVVDRHLSCHRRCRPSGRDSANEFTQLGRKRVRDTGTEKFLQRLAARSARLRIEQSCLDETRTRAMHLRSAHPQLASQNSEGPLHAR